MSITTLAYPFIHQVMKAQHSATLMTSAISLTRTQTLISGQQREEVHRSITNVMKIKITLSMIAPISALSSLRTT